MDQLFDLAEFTVGLQTFGPGLHLSQRFHIGGQPGQSVGGGLIGLKQRTADTAVFAYAVLNMRTGRIKQFFGRGYGRTGQRHQIGEQSGLGHRDILSVMGHHLFLLRCSMI